jgi:hypothetical protein
MHTKGGSDPRIGHTTSTTEDEDEWEAEVERRGEGEYVNSPLTELRLFPLEDLGFQAQGSCAPTWTQVRAGTDLPMESVEVYAGARVGMEAYRCGATGKATACVECVEGRGVGGEGDIRRPHADGVVLPDGREVCVGEGGERLECG